MNDRVVQFPNRYKLTPVSGDIYDLTPEPGIVTEPGTDLNKATLLSDTTAAQLRLSGDPTVDEALKKIPSAELRVLVGSGIVVTATFDGKTLTATAGTDGVAVLYPADFGVWTLKATIGGSLVTQEFTVDAIAVFYTSMATLESLSWPVVSSVSESGRASSLWNIGDEKTLTVNGVSYTAVIVGFDHDNLTTPIGVRTKAGITFQLKDCLATTYPMEASDINTNGWGGCVMRQTTMATLFNQLPSALRDAIKHVNKLTSAGNQSSNILTSSDRLFLLSEMEVFGTITSSKAGEGSQYAYYAAGNSTIKYRSGSASHWWERSPTGSSATGFCHVHSSGTAANTYTASSSYGVAFGFCV